MLVDDFTRNLAWEVVLPALSYETHIIGPPAVTGVISPYSGTPLKIPEGIGTKIAWSGPEVVTVHV